MDTTHRMRYTHRNNHTIPRTDHPTTPPRPITTVQHTTPYRTTPAHCRGTIHRKRTPARTHQRHQHQHTLNTGANTRCQPTRTPLPPLHLPLLHTNRPRYHHRRPQRHNTHRCTQRRRGTVRRAAYLGRGQQGGRGYRRGGVKGDRWREVQDTFWEVEYEAGEAHYVCHRGAIFGEGWKMPCVCHAGESCQCLCLYRITR